MNLIVAVDKNFAIGKKNGLLYHIPEDLKYFKETTINKTVIMGEKTVFSLPGGKVLPKRNTIVMTLDKSLIIENATMVYSIQELLEEVKKYNEDDVFVCGGATIYRLLLPYCKKAYITKIEAETKDADVFFENIDNLSNWEVEKSSELIDNGQYKFRFMIYKNNNVKQG